jgi:hypothetical protein
MMADRPFIVLALPRSRTYWISKFLSYGDYHCGHDELQHCRSLDDCRAWYRQPCVGTVETAAAPFWRLIVREWPDMRIVTIRRSVAAVLASVVRVIPACDRAVMRTTLMALDHKLDQIEARVPGVLRLDYGELATERGCVRLFEHCLPYDHDPVWWAWRQAERISGDLAAQVRYCRAYLPQLEKLARAAKHRILADMAPIERPETWEGFTFQDEQFDRWYADAAPLFREHMAATGQDIEDWRLKNHSMLRRLDNVGALQVMTARCNGALFGYLVTIIGPSLDAQDVMEAHHLPFFARPDVPGLGMKLQRASIEALCRKGVAAVIGRAGTRGSGPRLGTVYRRLGFEPAGNLYLLELKEARAWASSLPQ